MLIEPVVLYVCTSDNDVGVKTANTDKPPRLPSFLPSFPLYVLEKKKHSHGHVTIFDRGDSVPGAFILMHVYIDSALAQRSR